MPNQAETKRESRYGRPTTLRLKPHEKRIVADILAEREHRTGRRATLSALFRELIQAEHSKRC